MVNEKLLDDLYDRIRAWRRDSGMSKLAFANLAGVAKRTVAKMDEPEWSPSGTTVRALLRMMDGPAGRLACGAVRLEPLSAGVVPSIGPGEQRCMERVLRPHALSALGHDALARLYAGVTAGGPRPAVTPGRAMEMARAACPGAAVHLVDAYAADPRQFRIIAWDFQHTDYRGGIDLTGAALLDIDDDAYRAQLARAYGETRASGLARVSFLHRRGVGGRRTFHRLLVPFPGPTGGAEIVSVILPEKPEAARYLFPHRLRV